MGLLIASYFIVVVTVIHSATGHIRDFDSNNRLTNYLAQANEPSEYSLNEYNGISELLDLAFDATNHPNELHNLVKFVASPENEVYNITTQCIADLLKLGTDIVKYASASASFRKCNKTDCLCLQKQSNEKKKYSYIFEVLDSFGKPPPGILQANTFWLGDYHQCLSLKDHYNPKYCTASVAINFGVDGSAGSTQYSCGANNSIINAGDPLKNTHKLAQTSRLLWGICIPNSCQADTVRTMLNGVLSRLTNGANRVYSVDCHTPQKISSDPIAIAALITASLFLAVMVFSTAYDWFSYQPGLKNFIHKLSFMDHPMTAKKATEIFYYEIGTFTKILLAFSLYTNVPKVLSVEKRGGQLDCLHGIRFISMTWVILGHTYYYAANWIDNLKWFSRILGQFGTLTVINATVSVDTFFTLSGLLLTYLWMMETSKQKEKNITNPKHWILFYVHRFLRLTPAYMLILFMDVGLFQYMTDGPLWPQNGYEPNRCNTWWMNLLYINNFENHETVCFGWSWYLANDMQFYWISPIFLVLFTKIGLFTLIPCIGLIGVSAGLRAMFYIQKNITPNSVWTKNPAPFNTDPLIGADYFDNMYVRPYMRCGPYIVGMCTGYILYRLAIRPKKFRMPKLVVLIGWVLAALFTTWALYGPYEVMIGNPVSKSYIAFYGAINRTVWSIGIAWVIFACVRGYGGVVNRFLSWNLLLPLSRLTYCAYLLHELVVSLSVRGATRATHFDTHYTMLYSFFGHCVVAYAGAFVFSMAFEAPIITIEKLIFQPPKSPKVKDVKMVSTVDPDIVKPNGLTRNY